MDKVREEFEKFYSKRNQYGEAHKQELWEVWIASRDSVIVQLPENCKGNALTVSELKEQLDKAGVKYDF
jgi:hypothetical protein